MTNDPIYRALLRDPARLVAVRVCDLLGRMTLPEKVGQMLQLDARGILPTSLPKIGRFAFVQVDLTW